MIFGGVVLTYLCNSQLPPISNLPRLLQIPFEVLLFIAPSISMNSYEINGASLTLLHELLQPREADAILTCYTR